MEIVVMIIMLMVGISFLLKMTYHGIAGVIATTLVAALFVGMTWEFAINQSKTQISDWLMRPDLMLDTAVLLTVDIACQIAFCFFMARKLTNDPMGKVQTVLLEVLRWFPGVLIFPVLFSVLTSLIFSLSGVDFATIGWGLAGALLIAVPLLSYGFKYLLPEADLRLELMFLVNLLTIALGVVATVNGRTASVGTNDVDLLALAAVFIILIGGIIAGLIVNKYIIRKQISKIK